MTSAYDRTRRARMGLDGAAPIRTIADCGGLPHLTPAVSSAAGDEGLGEIRVLLFEPETRVRLALSNWLRERGIRVFEADDLLMLSILSVCLAPTVVLVNATTTSSAAQEVFGVLQRHPRTKHVPRVAYVASSGACPVQEARLDSFTRVVAPPAPFDAIMDAIIAASSSDQPGPL